MSQTITGTGGTYLALRVAAAADPGEGGAGLRWRAHVCDPASPLAGICASAPSLSEARNAVAVLAWAAVTAGELVAFGHPEGSLAGIHVSLETVTAFDAGWLAAAVADGAA